MKNPWLARVVGTHAGICEEKLAFFTDCKNSKRKKDDKKVITEQNWVIFRSLILFSLYWKHLRLKKEAILHLSALPRALYSGDTIVLVYPSPLKE